MQIIPKKIVILLLLIITISCGDNDEPIVFTETNTLEFFQELDISYGNDSDQVFDLYLPANRTANTKVMILIHGGGWTSGDKVEMNDFKNFILQNIPDIAVVNMNYRLADNTTNHICLVVCIKSITPKHRQMRTSTYTNKTNIITYNK